MPEIAGTKAPIGSGRMNALSAFTIKARIFCEFMIKLTPLPGMRGQFRNESRFQNVTLTSHLY